MFFIHLWFMNYFALPCFSFQMPKNLLSNIRSAIVRNPCTNHPDLNNFQNTIIKLKQAEKLNNHEMKEGWMKNDEEWWWMNEEWWRMKDGWWIQAVEGFCWRTDRRTNKQSFVIVESLSRLKTARCKVIKFGK